MPVIIQYLIKLSFSLALVYLFYHLLLRKLTFYNCNRIYLLIYPALCFIIPLINITPALEANQWSKDRFMSIPAWQVVQTDEAINQPVAVSAYDTWDALLLVLVAGTMVLVVLFCVRYISFVRIRRQARLLSEGQTRIYQVDKNIIPFSFGNAIFINHNLHNEDELREIIRHEFVHVKQKHSIDIMWAEVLCMINWYNPFVWLLRKSVRQNLEFIADEQVLKSGLDRKQYQYMLLKVIGHNHFSIASQFNFSSLKKRIAMMNKAQTSKRHLLRLLLIGPAVAVLLLAFRSQTRSDNTAPDRSQSVSPESSIAAVSTPDAAAKPDSYDLPSATSAVAPITSADTIPLLVNEKGYNISVKRGDVVVVRDANRKIVKTVPLADWNKDLARYENLYGEVPPPPPPPPVEPPPVAPFSAQAPAAPGDAPAPPPPPPAVPRNASMPAQPPAPPKAPKLPANVSSMQVTNGSATVTLKNGKTESYDLNDARQKAAFEKKYGELPEPPQPPAVGGISSHKPTASELSFVKRHANVSRVSWGKVVDVTTGGLTPGYQQASIKKNDVYIQIYFRNGKWDMYNTSNAKDIERFKKNYGEAPPTAPYGEGC
ncbi:M56 family metallopeptidase [Terrimonas ginsenosidimutans]|uniref:M56 family metallopeptidase n=1 Tax=Terrimonas ginsenosidimutans TaxID=2908004 RepID=UPI00254642AC|nr:M56 family metallopeptidase [Terrimonas ginsenosidimutans]